MSGGTPDSTYLAHIRSAAETASRDSDALVAKLGTVGLTLAGAANGYLSGPSAVLGWSAFLFALATVVSLLAGRLSADGLRLLVEDVDTGMKLETAYANRRRLFGAVKCLNWGAFVAITFGFLFATIFVAFSTRRLAI